MGDVLRRREVAQDIMKIDIARAHEAAAGDLAIVRFHRHPAEEPSSRVDIVAALGLRILNDAD